MGFLCGSCTARVVRLKQSIGLQLIKTIPAVGDVIIERSSCSTPKKAGGSNLDRWNHKIGKGPCMPEYEWK